MRSLAATGVVLLWSSLPSALLAASSFELSAPFNPRFAGSNDVNFDDWISNAPDEITEWRYLNVKGRIPDYVHGTLVRNGPGLWSKGDDKSFSHIFDGLAKISAYRIQNDGSVLYKNQFVQSAFYKRIQRENTIPRVLSVGPILSKRNNMQPRTGRIAVIQAVQNTLFFDNACVNVWDYDPDEKTNNPALHAISDTPCRGILEGDHYTTRSSSASAPKSISGMPLGYEFIETAHPLYSLTSDDTYNMAVCFTPLGTKLVLVKESPDGNRKAVGKVASPDGVPYLHAFGLTDRHAVTVVQPLRTNIGNFKAFLAKGFLRSMLPVDQTRVVVFDLKTGDCVLDQYIDEKVYFYHSVSTATTRNEEGQDEISLRLCAYKTPDIITGDDQFMRLERCQKSKEARNRITRGGSFCDVLCNLETKDVKVDWKPMEYGQGFELPTTRYSRSYGPEASFVAKKHPQYVYAYGAFAFGTSEYDSWGLFKFEPDKGRIAAAYRRESVYVSEPIFVAYPNGKGEDDGVLLSQVYDGKRQETALLVLDAKTMKVVAEAWTGNRSPMDFHGGWFPAVKGSQ